MIDMKGSADRATKDAFFLDGFEKLIADRLPASGAIELLARRASLPSIRPEVDIMGSQLPTSAQDLLDEIIHGVGHREKITPKLRSGKGIESFSGLTVLNE
jgi:hypothetical protein